MKLLRCENMHFYDGDKFSQCPYCANSSDSTALNRFEENGIALNAIENAAQIRENDYHPTEIIDRN